MCQVPKRCGERNEESRRHDKTVFVHWQVVVDAVENEMEGNANSVVRDIA
jgi:hypothetical protein